jgi:hypothetical protein
MYWDRKKLPRLEVQTPPGQQFPTEIQYESTPVSATLSRLRSPTRCQQNVAHLFVYQALKAYRKCVGKAPRVINLGSGRREGSRLTERTEGWPTLRLSLDIVGW